MEDAVFNSRHAAVLRLALGVRWPVPSVLPAFYPGPPLLPAQQTRQIPFVDQPETALLVLLETVRTLAADGGYPGTSPKVHASLFLYSYSDPNPELAGVPPERARLSYFRHRVSYVAPRYLLGVSDALSDAAIRLMRLFPDFPTGNPSTQGIAGEAMASARICVGTKSDPNWHAMPDALGEVNSTIAVPLVAYYRTQLVQVRYLLGAFCLSSDGCMLPAEYARTLSQPCDLPQTPAPRLRALRDFATCIAELLLFQAWVHGESLDYRPLEVDLCLHTRNWRWVTLTYSPESGLMQTPRDSDPFIQDTDDDGVVEVDGALYQYSWPRPTT